MAEPLNPEDIETTTFPTSLRGYDRDSVDIFLQEVAAAYEAALSESQAARSGEEKPYRSLGEEMGDLLQHAKDSADQTRALAQKEATARLAAAQEEAARLRADAEVQAAEVISAAETEADRRVTDAAETVEQLERMQNEARAEVQGLRLRLEALVDHLRDLEVREGGPRQMPERNLLDRNVDTYAPDTASEVDGDSASSFRQVDPPAEDSGPVEPLEQETLAQPAVSLEDEEPAQRG